MQTDAGARVLGEYVANPSSDAVPAEGRERAKYLILDSIAVSLGGTKLEQGRAMTRFWDAFGGVGDATVPGAESRLPVLTAAYVNSYLANLLDYDDTYSGRAVGHPGATVIPPALAVAEREHASGRAFLDAVVAGYEASIRVGDAVMPTPERAREVVSTATWQLFGATAATAHLLELDADASADAFALAGVSAPVPAVRKVGIEEDELHDLKNNYGWGSMGGVKAALLANEGFRGNRTIFDGEKGFWRMAASDQYDPAILEEGVRDGPALLDVSFKPYSSCRWSHATLDCVTELAADVGDVSEVESVTVETFHEARTLDAIPETVLEAQFSIPYVTAVTLLGYPTGFEWLLEERLDDPRVQALAERVSLGEDPEMTADYERSGQMRARVTVDLADGTSMTAAVDNPSGGPANPITYDEVESKYEALVEPVLGESTAAELKRRVLAIESETDVADVARLLGFAE
ncbi:MAG: MmgE/PrpD family protein [Halobacteriaceae archaeon]